MSSRMGSAWKGYKFYFSDCLCSSRHMRLLSRLYTVGNQVIDMYTLRMKVLITTLCCMQHTKNTYWHSIGVPDIHLSVRD